MTFISCLILDSSRVDPFSRDFSPTVQDKDIELEIEELPVGEKSRLKGLTLEESRIRQEMNVIIVAIRKKNGEMKFNPSSQSIIESGDILIALGYGSELVRLSSILSGR